MDHSELADDFEVPAAASWMVHADALLLSGDPRGSAIAIDLRLDQLEDASARAGLIEQREALIERHASDWLGPAAASLDHSHVRLAWRCGHLQRVSLYAYDDGPRDEEIAALLGCEACCFLPRLHVDCGPDQLEPMLDILSAAPRPLRELTLQVNYRLPPRPYPSARAISLCESLPRLRVLTLVGQHMLEDFPHAQLVELVVRGAEALVGLGLWTELPALQMLRLGLESGTLDRLRVPTQRLGELVSGAGMPALRALDLTMNGPSDAPSFGRDQHAQLLDALLESPLLAQLDELVLPSLPIASHERILLALAQAGVPRVRIPKSYHAIARELCPALEVGIVYPNRPASSVHGREVVEFMIGDARSSWIGMSRIARMIEDRYFVLSDAARLALDELFERFDEIGYSDSDDEPKTAELALAPLHAGFVEAFVDAEPNTGIEGLIEFLGEWLGRAERCTIRKIWGW